jgi:hypothetical protein
MSAWPCKALALDVLHKAAYSLVTGTVSDARSPRLGQRPTKQSSKGIQMPRGPLPLIAHQTIEPLAALLLIGAPWIFGFSDNDTATTLSIIVGVIVLLTGMSTRWRMSLVKLIPLRTHFVMDVGIAIVLIALPFVAGFSDDGGATRFFVIAGVLELGTALMTRWDEREEVRTERGGGTTAAR